VKELLRNVSAYVARHVRVGGISMVIVAVAVAAGGKPLALSADVFAVGALMITVGTLSRRALLREEAEKGDRKLL